MLLPSCERNEETTDDYANCRYDKPEAIFYDGLPQISDHQFQLKGRAGEERFTLSGGIRVTIYQYGCDSRTQEFIFESGNANLCDAPDDCLRQVIQLFQALSRLGPEYHVFRVWAQAMKSEGASLRYGKNLQLAEGFWMKLDQKRGHGSTTLMLTLSEKE